MVLRARTLSEPYWELAFKQSLRKASPLSVGRRPRAALHWPSILIETSDHRNQLNMGLFNVTLQDEEFYTHAKEGKAITVDKAAKTIAIEGCSTVFRYEQAQIEEQLLNAGGILPLYKLHGRNVFTEIIKSKGGRAQDIGSTKVLDVVFGKESGRDDLDW